MIRGAFINVVACADDLHRVSKNVPSTFYFLNNSVKNQPILTSFGTQNSGEI